MNRGVMAIVALALALSGPSGTVLAQALTSQVPATPQDQADPHARPALNTAPQPPADPAYPHKWDGNATGFVVGPILSHLRQSLPTVPSQGYGVYAAARISFIAQFADFELNLAHRSHGPLQLTEIGGQMAIHPAFPMLVFNDFLNDVVAGFHGYAGPSLSRVGLDGVQAVAATGQSGPSATDWRVGLRVGAGIDIPLSEMHDKPLHDRGVSSGWWLTLRYEARWLGFGSHNPDWDMGGTQALILLGWRSYNNGWAQVPRPF